MSDVVGMTCAGLIVAASFVVTFALVVAAAAAVNAISMGLAFRSAFNEKGKTA